MIHLSRTNAEARTGVILTSTDARFTPGQRVALRVCTLGGRTTLEIDGHPAHLDTTAPDASVILPFHVGEVLRLNVDHGVVTHHPAPVGTPVPFR